MAQTITYMQTLETTTCWCGINFAVPADLLQHAHNDEQTIYCPLGHTVVWRETEAMRLKKKLEQVEAVAARRLAQIDRDRAEIEAERRSHSATKGVLTKTKKRVQGGACPCCNRSFVELGRHMKTKHPDYATVS